MEAQEDIEVISEEPPEKEAERELTRKDFR